MSAISIRSAEPGDIAAITRIYADSVRHGTASFEIEAPDEIEMARRYDALRTGGFPFLAAEISGVFSGYAYAGPYRARAAFRWTVEDLIYVAPEARHRGVGRLLLDRLMTESAAAGFRQMVAVIGDSANLASIGLHRRAGFRMIGTLPDVGFKFGRWVDSVLMQRELGDGSKTVP